MKKGGVCRISLLWISSIIAFHLFTVRHSLYAKKMAPLFLLFTSVLDSDVDWAVGSNLSVDRQRPIITRIFEQ